MLLPWHSFRADMDVTNMQNEELTVTVNRAWHPMVLLRCSTALLPGSNSLCLQPFFFAFVLSNLICKYNDRSTYAFPISHLEFRDRAA
jgi:hypothetical protein